MNIEENIFKRYFPDYKKLINFGFVDKKDFYFYEKNFLNNQFKAEIFIYKKGNIKGRVIDKENDEEYSLFRVPSAEGEFVGKVKDEFEKILIDIRENCFKKDYFIYPQTNRITDLIIKKYNTQPEFPWEKYDGAGIFRNKTTEKWFALIMNIDKSKIIKNKKGLVEILNIKLSKDHIKEYTEKENFYPAYHMNKIHWLTIILDDSVKDEKILELIEESFGFSKGKKE